MSREQQKSLDEGINLFNDGRYFEAHEEWEHAWRMMAAGDDKRFFQGLIMAAASVVHYLQRECRGSLETLKKSLEFLPAGLNGHPDISIGLLIEDLGRLRDSFEACSYGVHGVPPKALPIIHRKPVSG